VYLLEVGLVIVLLPHLDDLVEVVDEPQLPRVLLVNFLPDSPRNEQNEQP